MPRLQKLWSPFGGRVHAGCIVIKKGTFQSFSILEEPRRLLNFLRKRPFIRCLRSWILVILSLRRQAWLQRSV